MNYSTAVMLINQNIRAINVSYEPDTEHETKPRYTFKTLDETIEVDDYVVIPTDTRHLMTVAKVEEVDADIDFESSIQIKWIISKFSKHGHNTILEEEKKWIEQLKAAEKRRKREEIKKSMLEMYEDSGIEELPIAKMEGVAAIEHKD